MQNILDRITQLYKDLTAMITIDQALLIAGILLVLVIILLIVISGMSRRNEENLESAESKASYEREALQKQLADAQAKLSEKDARIVALEAMASEAAGSSTPKSAAAFAPEPTTFAATNVTPAPAIAPEPAEAPVISESADKPRDAATAVPQEKFVSVSGADIEAQRILSDARSQAYTIINQADETYMEIITRANEDAEFIRDKANDHILRAHESLKHARLRANEIISDAQTEAYRLRRRAAEAPALINETVERPIVIHVDDDDADVE